MADWKLEKVEPHNYAFSNDDAAAGLVWLLTLTNERDIYVFAGGPGLYQAAKQAIEYVGDAESPEAVKLFEVLSEAINKAEGLG